jgi:hypothetical protein
MVTASVFRAPRSYTGEDTVEFGCHGSMVVADEIVAALIEAGARLAEPGEFTRRAFLNGKLDLTQVEAVADLIYATSVPGARLAARQLVGGLTQRLRHLREQLLQAGSTAGAGVGFCRGGPGVCAARGAAAPALPRGGDVPPIGGVLPGCTGVALGLLRGACGVSERGEVLPLQCAPAAATGDCESVAGDNARLPGGEPLPRWHTGAPDRYRRGAGSCRYH